MSETIRIESNALIVDVSSLGAEMQSLAHRDGRQWLWHGDAAWWSGRAPLLFPIVGKAPDDSLAIGGTRYPMKQHGFARRSEFALTQSDNSFCRHELKASAETRAVYPFDFSLSLEHRLDGAILRVTATVTNEGTDVMPYGIGFHPAFLWPLPGGEGKPHTVTLGNGAEPPLARLHDGYLAADHLPSPFHAGRLVLESGFFDADAMIFPEGTGSELTYAANGGPCLKFRFENLPNLALWQKPGAPFLCIEPWHGMAAHAGGTAELTERPFTAALAAGESANYGFSVELPA